MVTAGMLPRAAVREVEARLRAAGCPDADFDAAELFRLATGRDVRLSDRPLTAEQAAALEVLCTRRAAREPLQYLCGSWRSLQREHFTLFNKYFPAQNRKQARHAENTGNKRFGNSYFQPEAHSCTDKVHQPQRSGADNTVPHQLKRQRQKFYRYQ